MSNYKAPEKKASETVTFRMTLGERKLLEHLAELENRSLTDMVRHLIASHAERNGIRELPPPKPRRKPGRPSRAEAARLPTPAQEALPDAPQAPETAAAPPPVREKTFGHLVAHFRKHYAGRADGTRKELEATLAFLTGEDGGEPLLPPDLPLEALTSEKLAEVREAMALTDLRLAKKNLHLTYLRMMMHFAVKEEAIAVTVNPAVDLKPFVLSEMPDSWPFFSGPSPAK